MDNTNEEKTPSLRERVQHAMQQRDLTLRQLADTLDLNSGALSRWLTEKSTEAEEARVSEAVERWLTAPRNADTFVETKTARRIQDALAFAKANGDLVCIYGGPGVGKTRSIGHFAGQYAHVWTVTATPSSSTVVPALEEIAEAVGVTDASGGARRIQRAIRQRIRGLGGLLIIDEAQHLRPAALEEIRALHDATGVGLAFVGNVSVFSRLAGGKQASFAQLFSRIGLRLYLEAPVAADVAKLAKDRWNVTDRQVLELLGHVASQPGALRLVVKALGIAAESKRAITVDVVRAACVGLGIEVA